MRQGVTRAPRPKHYSVKEAVFPFGRFTNADTLLGPEMRSTGEVMGISDDPAIAFAKAQEGAGNALPSKGRVFVSVRDEDKTDAIELARRLHAMNFELLATSGTADALAAQGIPSERVNKVAEGSPHITDRLRSGDVAFVINTTSGMKAIEDSKSIRRQTLLQGLPYTTTIEAARAAVSAIEAMRKSVPSVKSLQEYQAK